MPMASTDNDPHDEERLSEVTHQIKATLTELLNHESVKCDDKFRHWVQDRLIDAEMELKTQRRRNRRKSSLDREAVDTIAESIRSHDLVRPSTTL